MVSKFFKDCSISSDIIDKDTGKTKLETSCLYSSGGVTRIFGLIENINIGDILVKKVSDTTEQRYIIKEIDYQKPGRHSSILPSTKLIVENIEKIKNETPSKTINTQYYCEGNQTINNNPGIIEIMELLSKKDFDNKDTIIEILKEYEKTKDKKKLASAVGFLANASQIFGFIYSLLK